MRFPGFIGPSYTLSSVNVDCQRCINLYPELNEMHTGKDQEVGSLIGTPGLLLLATIGSGPIRGTYYSTTGLYFVVSGNTLYSVTSSAVATSIGTLQTSSGYVDMVDNGIQLFIVDGPNGYYVTLATPTTLTIITDIQWLGSNRVSYHDTYFVFCKPSSNQFYISDPNDVTFSAPANSEKEGFPDNIVAHISVDRNLWLLGEETSEVWIDTGDPLNPFQYIQGSLSQVGCAAKFGVALSSNILFWLGKDKSGSGIVYMANGLVPQRVSNHAVEIAIQSYSDISDCIAYAYQKNGHQFVVFNFPTGNATWAFDVTTGMWHERGYLKNGTLQRHRSNSYSYAFGAHVVGDFENGNIYELSDTTYTDNGNPIMRRRAAPHISAEDHNIFFSKFQLDVESGTGLDGSGQGINPQAVLQWSNDGGHTWSNEHWATIGAIGATKNRAIWQRLGMSRNRVFRVTITDPVKVVMLGADLELEAGAS